MPASTMETYMMALLGEYCMAMRVHGASMASRALVQFLPGRVAAFGTGERVELAGLDAMDQLARLAFCGDDVVPAAADEAVVGQAEDAGGNGVAVMMIVEEPGFDAGLAQSGLNRVEVHRVQGIGGRV